MSRRTPVLELPRELRERIAGVATAGYPLETCGLMLGHEGEGRVRVTRLVPARNVHPERPRDRYTVDPRDHLAAERAARAAGLEVVGVWHSHPDHPARPSETDRAAAWPGWSYVIAAVTARGVTDLRAWRLRGRDFEEEVIRP